MDMKGMFILLLWDRMLYNYQIHLISCIISGLCFHIDFSLDGLCIDESGVLTHCLEKAMAPHSSTLAWKIPWMEETGRLQSMGSLRVGHD